MRSMTMSMIMLIGADEAGNDDSDDHDDGCDGDDGHYEEEADAPVMVMVTTEQDDEFLDCPCQTMMTTIAMMVMHSGRDSDARGDSDDNGTADDAGGE